MSIIQQIFAVHYNLYVSKMFIQNNGHHSVSFEVINYYNNNACNIYMCMLNTSKAFDCVHEWGGGAKTYLVHRFFLRFI